MIRGKPAPKGERTLEDLLFQESYVFDFFQAVRLMERLEPERKSVGGAELPATETVRFRARVSLDFPPSAIYEIVKPTPQLPVPAMTVSFLGLSGPSGILPRIYTEQLLRLEREGKGREKYALREWFDLFNHRFISLFFRAWEKYRFYPAFERREFSRHDPDPFSLCLFSLIGVGTPALRNRLTITTTEMRDGRPHEKSLGRIDDLAVLRYGGFFAHRPRNAVSLEAMLRSFLRVPVDVIQFQGQWLKLAATNCTSLGMANASMGANVIVGDRVWDVQSKIRIRLGPLTYAQFQSFLPDRAPVAGRKTLFLLTKLVRLYVGPEMDFEFQLVLKKEEVPACEVGAKGGIGSRLGWNTWSRRKPKSQDAEDVVFQAQDLTMIVAG